MKQTFFIKYETSFTNKYNFGSLLRLDISISLLVKQFNYIDGLTRGTRPNTLVVCKVISILTS
jgi:hypothetical protein